MAVSKGICLVVIFARSFSFILEAPRTVVKVLWVDQAGYWGTWGNKEFCPKGYYAVGYQMKIERQQGNGDDTALNAIRLVCENLDGGAPGGTITSKEGPWGNWENVVKCRQQNGQETYLTQFAFQSEGDQRGGDDTAANYIKFQCRDIVDRFASYELAAPPGQGMWGTMSPWSEACPENSAICGIQTKVEDPLGNGDDTALNDVRLMCCGLDY